MKFAHRMPAPALEPGALGRRISSKQMGIEWHEEIGGVFTFKIMIRI
jgi:hypothetical protein